MFGKVQSSSAVRDLQNYERMLISQTSGQRSMPTQGMHLQARQENPQANDDFGARLAVVERKLDLILNHLDLEIVPTQTGHRVSSSPQKRIHDIKARINSRKLGKSVPHDEDVVDDDDEHSPMFADEFKVRTKRSSEGSGVSQMTIIPINPFTNKIKSNNALQMPYTKASKKAKPAEEEEDEEEEDEEEEEEDEEEEKEVTGKKAASTRKSGFQPKGFK